VIRKFLVISFTLLICGSAVVLAETTGASFLSIGIGTRAIGMGSAFTSVANDVTAIHWNAAGLSQLNRREISAMHSEWVVNTKLDFIGYARPIKSGVIGGSIIYLSQSAIEGRDENRQQTGIFGASDLAVTMSYSRRLPELSNTISAGLNVRFIQQNIEVHTARGVAIDVGTLYQTPINNLKAGLSVQNIGGTDEIYIRAIQSTFNHNHRTWIHNRWISHCA